MSGLWEIHPRNADLTRTLDPVVGWDTLTLVERFNRPDTWVLQGSTLGLSVFGPGMGCILDRDGQQVASGVVSGIVAGSEWDEDEGRQVDTVTVSFISDDVHLHSRAVFPQPSKVLTGTPSAMDSTYDTRTGAIETLILDYVAANLGPAAPVTNRRLPALALPTTVGRGGDTTVNARMDTLGVLVHDLAEAGRLRVRVQHSEVGGTPHLALTIEEVPDLTEDVRFGPPQAAATGLISGWRYELSAPTATRVIAWAEGALEERLAAQVIDADAETLWGRAVEQVVDTRWTGDGEEIARALVDGINAGATPISVVFSVVDGPDLAYRRDYTVGAKVGVELPGLDPEVSDNVIREVTTTVTVEGEQVVVVVGSPESSLHSTAEAVRLARALRRLSAVERSM